ncbi:MAG: hypothetical protein Q9188_002558 [Gyalolechia gomerana]
MRDVNRIGFTELAGTEGAGNHSAGSKRVKYGRSSISETYVLTHDSVILVHGLRGHPYKTWASNQKAGNQGAAIRRSEACRRRTRLIVFLGTPHRGTAGTGWGQIASHLARVALPDSHKKILETMEVDGEVLDNIHEQFVPVVFEHDIHIHSFQEGRGMPGIKGLDGKVGCPSLKHAISDLTNPHGQIQVVSDFSSKLGLPKLETIESIDANHTQMARCMDRSDESYRFVAGVAKQFLKNASLNAEHKAEVPCSTTSSYCIPFLRNQHFIGRTEKLKELQEKLIVSSHCQKLALVGLGGVGKTQVALQFAYTVKEHWPEYSILWAPAISAEIFERAYRDIATRCSIALDPEQEDPKESVRRYLNSDSAGKWLLNVDNADDKEILFGESSESESVMDYLPQSENGLTMFTTRHREIAVLLARHEVVEVQEMDQEEAKTFLKQSLTQKEMLYDQKNTTELLDELSFLPLAIAQAAAYLNAMQISVPEYLSLLRSTEQDTDSLLSREFHDDTRYQNSKNSVAATWLDSDSYDMHRLVHLATKVWLDKHGAREALNGKVATRLAEIFPSDDYSNRVLWREFLPHAPQFLRNTKKLDIEAKDRYPEDHPDRLASQHELARAYQADGQVKEAVKLLEHVIATREKVLKEDHPNRLASQHELARAYKADGQVKKAVKLLEQVVAIREKVLKEDHPNRLASQHELAGAYEADGQVKEAVKLLEHVVVIEKKILQEDHPSRLASQHQLAIVYKADGQVKEAVKLLEYVVTIRKRVFREDHPSRVISQRALLILHAQQRSEGGSNEN